MAALTKEQHDNLVAKLDDGDRAIYNWLLARYKFYLYSDALNTMREDYAMAMKYEDILDDFLKDKSWKYMR